MWSTLDIAIIVIYLVFITAMGFILKRKASAGIESYFLGGRRIPWWVLGASGMASNLDVTGTMVAISWIFLLGLNGYWNLMSGHTCIMIAVYMVMTGKWMRRTGAMTSAEWMEMRFGSGKAGQAARQLTAYSNIIAVIGGTMYFLIGTGKFVAEYVPLESLWNLPSEAAINAAFQTELALVAEHGRVILGEGVSTAQALAAAVADGMAVPAEPIMPFFSEEFVCAGIIVLIALVYTMASGYYGVVFTDLFQGFLIGFIVIYVAVRAFMMVGESPEAFRAIEAIPPFWENVIPPWRWDTAKYGQLYKGFEMMLPICFFFTARSVVSGFGGTQGYMAQRWLSCRDDREAGLMSFLWVHLLAFRWPFIIGAAAIGYILMSKDAAMAEAIQADPERVLPFILMDRDVIGVGFFGLIMASLLATGMSSFDSGVNAGASFVVRDIYQRYLRPKANDKELIRVSYVATILIVIVAVLLSKSVKNINDIWTWLMVGLGGGGFIPMLLMWYWPRMNGQGFAAGLGAGMVAAIGQRLIAPDLGPIMIFVCSATPSLILTILVSWMTPEADIEHVKAFYKRVRPFGFWGKVRVHFTEESLERTRKENRRDLLAVFIATPWQALLFFVPMLLIIHAWTKFWVCLAVLIALYVALYFVWLRHLRQPSPELEEINET